jgi:uncharacterized protein YndB with AHSA1/START domain
MMRRELVLASGAALLSVGVIRNSLAASPAAGTRDLVVTRVFDAPVEKVWKAWVDPVLVMKWWGPDGFSSPLAEMDFREGGTSLVCMRSPDGTDMYSTWTYTQIVPLERFEYIFNLSDKDGNTLDPAALGLPPDFPRDARHSVVFKTLSPTRTEMTMTEFGYTSDQLFNLSKAGLEQTLDKMVAIFAAP